MRPSGLRPEPNHDAGFVSLVDTYNHERGNRTGPHADWVLGATALGRAVDAESTHAILV